MKTIAQLRSADAIGFAVVRLADLETYYTAFGS
jgi:hypothetical protein